MKKRTTKRQRDQWLMPELCPDCQAKIAPSTYDHSSVGSSSFTVSNWPPTSEPMRFALCAACGWRKTFKWKAWA